LKKYGANTKYLEDYKAARPNELLRESKLKRDQVFAKFLGTNMRFIPKSDVASVRRKMGAAKRAEFSQKYGVSNAVAGQVIERMLRKRKENGFEAMETDFYMNAAFDKQVQRVFAKIQVDTKKVQGLKNLPNNAKKAFIARIEKGENVVREAVQESKKREEEEEPVPIKKIVETKALVPVAETKAIVPVTNQNEKFYNARQSLPRSRGLLGGLKAKASRAMLRAPKAKAKAKAKAPVLALPAPNNNNNKFFNAKEQLNVSIGNKRKRENNKQPRKMPRRNAGPTPTPVKNSRNSKVEGVGEGVASLVKRFMPKPEPTLQRMGTRKNVKKAASLYLLKQKVRNEINTLTIPGKNKNAYKKQVNIAETNTQLLNIQRRIRQEGKKSA
jgi:hypothetical protein